MIDEKKLIDELKQSGMIADNEYGNAMVDIIENQPKVGSWIPCRMELPESEEWQIRTLLATVRYKNNTFVSTASFDCSNRKWLVDKGKEVIAWKPLPEIYAENHQA